MPIDPLEIILSSSLLGTLVTLFMKWRNDRKKAPLEREQLLATVSTQNVTDALAISKEWKDALSTTRQQMKDDAEQAEARAQRRIAKLQDRLTSLEQSNTDLVTKVTRLEEDDQINRGRIGKLETSLTAAKDTVVSLVEFISQHTDPPSGSIPQVDYSIFDI